LDEPREKKRAHTIHEIIGAYLKGYRKAYEEHWDKHHQQSLLLMGFLGGLTLTTLVLVISAKQYFDVSTTILGSWYFGFLIGSLEVTSFLSITVAFMNLIGSTGGPFRMRFNVFSMGGIAFAVVLLMYVLPLILLPFVEWEYAIALLALNVVLVGGAFSLTQPEPDYSDYPSV
jgi:hypothetical protein